MAYPIKIAGLGHYLPRRIVTNPEVEAICRLTPGWIQRNSGVCERRWASADESNSYMGAQAAIEALDSAGLEPQQIDLLVNASGSAEQAVPDTAPLIQSELGLGDSGIPCLTLHATCLSFVAALDLCSSLLATGRYRTILVVTSEIASPGINFAHPESASLLGDAAAAAVLTQAVPGEASCIHKAHMETYGMAARLTQVPGGGTRRHPNAAATESEDNLFQMQGQQVAKFALRYSSRFLDRLEPGLSQGLNNITLAIPHQASLLALHIYRRFGWPDDRVMVTLDKLGNCIAASIPVSLYLAVRQGRIRRGDRILLVGTGAGLSLGGVLLTY